MPRRVLRTVFTIIVALLVSGAFAFGAAQRADARRVLRPPPSPLEVHEWGVWLVENGRAVHLQDLANEVPNFVLRTSVGPDAVIPPPPPSAQVPPGPPPSHPVALPSTPPSPPPSFPVMARKPVIFLYAPAEMHVSVRVGFSQGRPWLYYPHATTTVGARDGQVVWDGTVTRGRAPLAPVDGASFWNDLRRVHAGTFLPSTTNAAESFLFYDGPTTFAPSFVRSGANVQATQPNNVDLWLVENGMYQHQRATTQLAPPQLLDRGDMRQLETALVRELRQRGLTQPEARSLVAVWRDEIVAQRRHVLTFLSRQTYDQMLPLTVTPTPRAVVRVGLVIDRT